MDLYNEISFQTSKLITKKYSTSFSIAVSNLPKEMRRSIYSIYGFVRLADEIVDTFPSKNQQILLNDFLNGDKDKYAQLKDSAMKLGSAFQKVNFLRDLKSDTQELNRLYFPDVDMDNFTEKVKYDLIKDIENDFNEAEMGMRQLPDKSKLAVYIAFSYYKKLLHKLKRTPANEIMQTRIRVQDSMKFVLLGKAYMKYKLNAI